MVLRVAMRTSRQYCTRCLLGGLCVILLVTLLLSHPHLFCPACTSTGGPPCTTTLHLTEPTPLSPLLSKRNSSRTTLLLRPPSESDSVWTAAKPSTGSEQFIPTLPEDNSTTSLLENSDTKPNATRLRKVLSLLNLTKDQSSSRLPLSLADPYLLSNDTLCDTEDGSPVDILFYVHSATGNVQRRHKMRSTFLSPRYFAPFGFKVRGVFLLGQTPDSGEQKALEQEHRQHGDLVQGQFLDTYHNLTHKGALGYRWIADHCPRARLVVKLDDDVFFDTYQLIFRYWHAMRGKTKAIMCNVWRGDTMLIEREGKWKVASELFRGRKFYPFHYCSGMTVLMTGDLIASLLAAARVTPVFWIDDFYLFGILPYVTANVTFYAVGEKVVEIQTNRGLTCLDSKEADCPLLSILTEDKLDVQKFDARWNSIQKRHVKNGWMVPAAYA